MDCIKGAIELGSECYPCVCEVIDALWPNDAPNCFKKEISKITKPIEKKDILQPQQAASSEENTINSTVHDEL